MKQHFKKHLNLSSLLFTLLCIGAIQMAVGAATPPPCKGEVVSSCSKIAYVLSPTADDCANYYEKTKKQGSAQCMKKDGAKHQCTNMNSSTKTKNMCTPPKPKSE